ncbi:MAG TPA: FMN-binding glutamate synthase family protein, partial [Gammaproteobacteria bacterium]|nr:FMN-binding glutamate synthase family protein [Gammaproteobacteria bacterium]
MIKPFFLVSVFVIAIVYLLSIWWPAFFLGYFVVIPLILVGIQDMLQTKHSIRRNFPLLGWGRWFLEFIRPYIRQYFIESDLDGAPISRTFRSVVYQRAKGQRDTIPFGTKIDVYRDGYEWIGHSLSAIVIPETQQDLRIMVGGRDCKQTYSSSIFNISAMSFGALSGNAIESLNLGAKLGGFFHNTGEGGISPHHMKYGGDLVWQIGTAYFGCRNEVGDFSPEIFAEKAALDQVKMIEIKLSQGAKPGHGGILPADKNTPEIAAIRGVEPYTQVNSPPTHSAFRTPLEMMTFIKLLRDLSGGKPIGIKLSIGRRSEFVAICKAMTETGIRPDFITVDGGEGGTGAAPLEYTNSIGMPLR